MAKAIYFDMDGTLANLYGVEDWLSRLDNEDATPYTEAGVLLNMQALAHRLNKLQSLGYTIGIVSWLSKEGSAAYNSAVREAKLAWLSEHLGSVKWDEIHIVAYGKQKHKLVNVKDGYLFDDNKGIRKAWVKNNPNGWAFDVDNILAVLDLMK